MKFSKDKRPTEPGTFWVLWPDENEPSAILFVEDDGLRFYTGARWASIDELDVDDFLFGDKIETPTVEVGGIGEGVGR